MEKIRITDLVSSRLHTLAALLANHAAMNYQRKFSLSLLEWRAIAMLGGFSPLASKDLARMAGLDRSHASRTVGGLIERALVESARNSDDGRGVMLSLSKKGRALYEKAFEDAVVRNNKLLATLTTEQRHQLLSLIDVLTSNARRMVDDERRVAAGERVSNIDAPPSDSPSENQGGSSRPKMDRIRQLVNELTVLVRE